MAGSQRVLIVEDERDVRDGLVSYFTAHGFEVSACERGADAVEATRTGRFGAVVLDLLLPDMHGLAVIRTLRAAANTRSLRIIAHSGVEHAAEADAAGANAFVLKPVAPSKLVELVRAELALHEAF